MIVNCDVFYLLTSDFPISSQDYWVADNKLGNFRQLGTVLLTYAKT